MLIAQIKQGNIAHNNKLQSTAILQTRNILKSLNKTKELLLKNPENKILRNILDDEIDLLTTYNRPFFK